MRSVSGKIFRDNQNTHFMFNNIFFENRAVYEIMCKITVQPDRHQIHIITQRRHISCWITKARNTQSEYVILTASHMQLCLHERASVLRYMYIASLVEIICLSGLSDS